MAVIDRDQFENTAAWLEHCDGLSRFAAETEAARRQGFKRHEVMNANSGRDSKQGGDIGQAPARRPEDDLPRVQHVQAQKVGPLLVGFISAGWGGLELLALPIQWGWLV